MVENTKDGWTFGTDVRTADKSFQLTPKDRLDIHIEAKWTTLRDWMEATYILNGRTLGVSKFSTMSYAIRESEKSLFLSEMKELLEAKRNNTRDIKIKEYTVWQDSYSYRMQGSSCDISLGRIHASIISHRVDLSDRKYRFWINFKVPYQNDWKTSQPKLPDLDKYSYSKDYDSMEEAKEACVEYIRNLLDREF